MATSVSTVGLLGAGKIASALVRGFLAADGLIAPDRIIAAAPHTDRIRVRRHRAVLRYNPYYLHGHAITSFMNMYI